MVKILKLKNAIFQVFLGKLYIYSHKLEKPLETIRVEMPSIKSNLVNKLQNNAEVGSITTFDMSEKQTTSDQSHCNIKFDKNM